MRRSETRGENNFESWIEDVGQNTAPEGFRQKVMAQVEVESLTKLERYSSPVSSSFRLAAIAIFTILTLVSIFIPEGKIFSTSKLGTIKLPQIPFPEVALPKFNFPDWIQMEYLALGGALIILLYILDRYLEKLFKT